MPLKKPFRAEMIIDCMGKLNIKITKIKYKCISERNLGGANFLHYLEDSKKPVIAAIHGTCLGGGFEIALASHYRVALDSARYKYDNAI